MRMLVPIVSLILGAIAGFAIARTSSCAVPAPASTPQTDVLTENTGDEGEFSAQTAPPGYSLSPPLHDFGTLLEGESREQELKLLLPSPAPVRIGRLYSPCPCISVSSPKRIYTAEEAIPVNVSVHSLTLEGEKTFPVYVELLEPQPATLRADVKVRVNRVPAKLLLVPPAIQLGSVRGEKEAAIRLLNLTKQPVRITSMQCSLASVTATADNQTLSPGKDSTIRIHVGAEGLPEGTVRGTLVIETDQPLHRRLEVPIEGTSLPALTK